MKKLKKIPEFKNENEEAEFWSAHDSTEYIDWSKAKIIFKSYHLGEPLDNLTRDDFYDGHKV